jgi:hypothetical protein
MNASIEQTAVCSLSRTRCVSQPYTGSQRAAVVVVDGVRFHSPTPVNAGEAESFNRAARSIVARINGRAT